MAQTPAIRSSIAKSSHTAGPKSNLGTVSTFQIGELRSAAMWQLILVSPWASSFNLRRYCIELIPARSKNRAYFSTENL